MFKFITRRSIWFNLFLAFLLGIGLIFGILQLLGILTNHGEYLKVPSVVGMNTNRAIDMLEEKGFEVVIYDSVYTDTAKKGTVLKQIPDPNSTVKINRTVLLTVNRVTMPLIDMPSLNGKSLNFALEIMHRSHLVLGDTTFRADFMRGSILEQRFRGDIIQPGTKIPWGSTIDLVVGSGLSDQPIPVPELIGLSFDEVKVLLEQSGILLGATILDPDVTDTASAFIWKQIPPSLNEVGEKLLIQPGQLMDLWLSVERKDLIDSLNKTN